MATERETSDNTETTRFSQCAHDQRRMLEAEDCNSIRCAQLISGGRRRIRPCPPRCLAHARPTMCCIRLVKMMTDAHLNQIIKTDTCTHTYFRHICIAFTFTRIIIIIHVCSVTPVREVYSTAVALQSKAHLHLSLLKLHLTVER